MKALLVGGTFDGMVAVLDENGDGPLIAIPVVIEAVALGEKVSVTVYHVYGNLFRTVGLVYGFTSVEHGEVYPGSPYAMCPLALERVVA